MKTKTLTAFTEKGLDGKIHDFITDLNQSTGNSHQIIEINFSATLLYLAAMVVYQ